MPTGTTTRASRAGTQVANEAAAEGQQVADVASAEGRRVASQAADQGREVATSASERTGALVGQARQEARDLAGTVRDRASEVTDQVAEQTRSLVDETRSQLEGQAKAGAQRLAGTFRDFGEEAQALAEGRPHDAPNLSEYAYRAADACFGAADRLSELADDVETRGFTGVLDDLQTYARRRPGMFLLGAALVGFGVGRLVKAESAQRGQGDEDQDYRTNGQTARGRAITTRTAR